jgi:hypothetical protein
MSDIAASRFLIIFGTPKKIKNLEVVMSLSDHSMYTEFCVNPFFILTQCVGTKHHIYYRTV